MGTSDETADTGEVDPASKNTDDAKPVERRRRGSMVVPIWRFALASNDWLSRHAYVKASIIFFVGFVFGLGSAAQLPDKRADPTVSNIALDTDGTLNIAAETLFAASLIDASVEELVTTDATRRCTLRKQANPVTGAEVRVEPVGDNARPFSRLRLEMVGHWKVGITADKSTVEFCPSNRKVWATLDSADPVLVSEQGMTASCVDPDGRNIGRPGGEHRIELTGRSTIKALLTGCVMSDSASRPLVVTFRGQEERPVPVLTRLPVRGIAGHVSQRAVIQTGRYRSCTLDPTKGEIGTAFKLLAPSEDNAPPCERGNAMPSESCPVWVTLDWMPSSREAKASMEWYGSAYWRDLETCTIDLGGAAIRVSDLAMRVLRWN